MTVPLPEFEGSAELAAIIFRLHAWFGRGSFSHADASIGVLTAVKRPPREDRIEQYLNDSLQSLVRCHCLESVAGQAGVFALTDRAWRFAETRAALVSQDIDVLAENLDTLFDDSTPDRPPENPADDGDDFNIHQVTKTFLEDLLSEACLPPEIIDRIHTAYRECGRLEMSADGQKYTIYLKRDDA